LEGIGVGRHRIDRRLLAERIDRWSNRIANILALSDWIGDRHIRIHQQLQKSGKTTNVALAPF